MPRLRIEEKPSERARRIAKKAAERERRIDMIEEVISRGLEKKGVTPRGLAETIYFVMWANDPDD